MPDVVLFRPVVLPMPVVAGLAAGALAVPPVPTVVPVVCVLPRVEAPEVPVVCVLPRIEAPDVGKSFVVFVVFVDLLPAVVVFCVVVVVFPFVV
jgi:hypothetical protein